MQRAIGHLSKPEVQINNVIKEVDITFHLFRPEVITAYLIKKGYPPDSVLACFPEPTREYLSDITSLSFEEVVARFYDMYLEVIRAFSGKEGEYHACAARP